MISSTITKSSEKKMFIGTSTRSQLACAVAALVLTLSQSLFAQGSGTLQGRVIDKETGEALVGANVSINNTSFGAAADLDGKYVIYRIPTGRQTVKISYIGYRQMTLDVTITENEPLTQDFRLTLGAVTGDTVVVTAQAKGQLASINEQLTSNNIINVVSAEKMQELPDANLAESIGRLPGVSLQRQNGEADKVIVRGLSPQFNNVTIEGVPMTSTSGGLAAGETNNGSSNYSDRSIDLGMLTDDVVKGVELSKSLRADMDANALGGTINLTLKQAPSGLHENLMVNGGYNDLTSYWKNYKVVGSVSDRFFDDAIGARVQLNLEDKALPSQQFNAGYDGVSTTSNKDSLGNITHTFLRNTNSARLTVDNLDRRRYGGSVILDYGSKFVDVTFFNLYTRREDNDSRHDDNVNFEFTPPDGLFTKLYSQSQFTTEERTHSLQAKFKVASTELDAAVSYAKTDYQNPGYDFPFMEVLTNPISKNSNVFVYATPSSLIGLAGADNPSNFYLRNLDHSYNFLNDNSYDAKVDYHIPFQLGDDLSGKISLGGKYHSFDRYNNGVGVFFDLEYGGSKNRQLEYLTWLQQNFGRTNKTTDVSHGVSGLNYMLSGYTPPKFLNGNYTLDNWGYDLPLLNTIGQQFFAHYADQYFGDGVQTYNSDYDDAERLHAGYIMGEFNIGQALTLVPGVRYENLQGAYGAYVVYANGSNQNGLQGEPPVWRSINTTHNNVLPSVNLKYKVSETVQIVGAYYQNLARPNFSDVSPLVDYGVAGNVNAASNAYLKPATGQNYELGTSIFSNTVGLFSVNAYYKKLNDLTYSIPGYEPYQQALIHDAPSDILSRLPQLTYFDTSWFHNGAQNSSLSMPINNPAAAYLRGLEVEWQTHFWYLPGVLSGLVLDLNYGVMSSSTYYPYFDNASNPIDTLWDAAHTRIKKINYWLEYRTREGSLVNMPKATYNITIGWDYLEFSSRVSFRYQYTELTSLDSRYSLADSYYDNVLLVDISLKQKLFENMSIFANLTNVGSHVDSYYYTSPKGPLPTSEQTYGFNAQFGLRYEY